MIRLTRAGEGDYRTTDGRWRILQPCCLDDGLETSWLLLRRNEEYGSWDAVYEDFETLGAAEDALGCV